MARGYSCYLRNDTSLLHLASGAIRVFGRSSRVIDAYRTQGSPPQRSFNLLHRGGLLSGACIALGESEVTHGFLFLNSNVEGYFDRLSSRSLLVFTLLSRHARSLIDASPTRADEDLRAFAGAERGWPHGPFSKETFHEALKAAFARTFLPHAPAVDLDVVGTAPFLMTPQQKAYAIARVSALATAGKEPPSIVSITVEIDSAQQVVRFLLPFTLPDDAQRLQLCERTAAACGMRSVTATGGWALEHTFEPTDGTIAYSV